MGEYSGSLNYIENTGTATAPVFVQRTGSANHLDGFSIGEISKPALGDLDNDGGMDVIIVNRDAPITMLHNTMEDRGNWIGSRAMGPHGDDAIGAVISAEIPGRTLTRPVLTGYSYLAANDPRIHLGLGAGSSLNQVRIRWPDGTTESFGSLPGGSVHLLQQGSGH